MLVVLRSSALVMSTVKYNSLEDTAGIDRQRRELVKIIHHEEDI